MEWASLLLIRKPGQCDGVEARPRFGRRSAVAETDMTGDAENHELREWQGVGWIY